MDVFQGDSEAFLRYSLAQNLNPKIVIRLFHSGPGTFWTNLDNKNMNLLLPTGGGAPSVVAPAAETGAAAGAAIGSAVGGALGAKPSKK